MPSAPSPSAAKPVVLVPACSQMLGEHPYLCAGRKYVDAVRLAGALPLVVPQAEPAELDTLLDLAHGVLLTGSLSNVHPRHYGQEVRDASLPLDPGRDDWTLSLIPRVLARGMPLFAICRGAQEANVALGGTLHQAVHEVPGHDDHRAPADRPADEQFAPAHDVAVEPGGLLERIVGAPRLRVNSVHGQAVDRLAAGLRVEARAGDGLVEAFSTVDARGFALCLQWHPEWRAAENPVSLRLFAAFGDAVRVYRDRHRKPRPP
jgi:putative glutamine amidotransferase